MMKPLRTIALALLALGCPGPEPGRANDPPPVRWIRQFGTDRNDTSRAVATDRSGNAYITGTTYGMHDAAQTTISVNAFLAKYDPAGNLRWTRQFGTAVIEGGYGVAVGNSGNVYVSGITTGSFGAANAGSVDLFLSKFDIDGEALWTRQIGTSEYDKAYAVAVDGSDNAFVTGSTYGSLEGDNAGESDAFLSKYDAAGNQLWTRQFGTGDHDNGWSVDLDHLGNAYVSGRTDGSLGGPNAGGTDNFIRKYDNEGNLMWTRQVAAPSADLSHAVAVDGSGNAYVTGYAWGELGEVRAGASDAYLGKYDTDGNLLWIRQFGTGDNDSGWGVAVDGLGDIYLTGKTQGDLEGPNAGSFDVFLRKYDAQGSLLWATQLGTAADDQALGVAVGGGQVYITGTTRGSLGGPNAGGSDVYLVAIVPEPGSLAMLAAAATTLFFLHRRRRSV